MEQAHIDIVKSGFEAEKHDDEILRDLFESGLEFNELRSTFNDVVKSEGLRLSAKDRKIKTAELLLDWVPTDTEDALSKVSLVKDALKVNDSKALAAIRAWAKDNGVTMPKPPRKVKEVKVGFGGHIRKILDVVVTQRDATRKDIEKMCEDNGVPVKYTTTILNIVDFANEWNTEVAVEETTED